MLTVQLVASCMVLQLNVWLFGYLLIWFVTYEMIRWTLTLFN